MTNLFRARLKGQRDSARPELGELDPVVKMRACSIQILSMHCKVKFDFLRGSNFLSSPNFSHSPRLLESFGSKNSCPGAVNNDDEKPQRAVD